MAFKKFFQIITLLYIIVLASGFSRNHGAYCSANDVYPNVMALLPMMFFANAGIAYHLKKNHFYMKKDSDDQKLRVNKELILAQGEAFFKTTRVVLVM